MIDQAPLARAMALITAADDARGDDPGRRALAALLAAEIVADPRAVEIIVSLALIPTAMANVTESQVSWVLDDEHLPMLVALRAATARPLTAADVGLDRANMLRTAGLGIARQS